MLENFARVSPSSCRESGKNSCRKCAQVCHTLAHVIGEFTPEGARARCHARFSAPDGDGCLLRPSCLPIIPTCSGALRFSREEILICSTAVRENYIHGEISYSLGGITPARRYVVARAE